MADNLTITLGADSSKLRADLAVVQAQMRQFGSELRRAAQESLKTGDQSALRGLATQFEDARGKAAALTAALKDHTAAHGGFRAALMASGQAFNDIRARAGEFGAALNTTANNVFPHFQTILAIGLGAAIVEFTNKVKEANSQIRETENLSKALGFTTDQFEAAGLVAAKFAVSNEEMARGLARSHRALGELRVEGIKLSGELPIKGVVTLRGNVKNLGDAAIVARGGMHQLSEGITGVVQVARGGEKQLGDISKLFLDIANNPQLDDMQKEIAVARRIDKLGDSMLKADVAAKQYGRSWVTLLPAILGMADGLEKAQKEIEASGLGLQDYEKEQARTFNAARAEFEFYYERVQQIIFGALGTAFVPFYTEVTQLFKDNADAIRQWAASAGASISAVAKDLVGLFKGEAPKTEWVKDLATAFQGLKEIASGLMFALRGIIGVLDLIAAGINAAFGTHLSGAAIAAALVIGHMTGLFGLLNAGIALVDTTLARLITGPLARLAPLFGRIAVATAGAAGWPFLIVAGLVAVGVAIYENWDTIKEWVNWISTNVGEAWQSAVKSIEDAWSGMVKWVSDGIDSVIGFIDGLIDKAKAAASALASLFKGSNAAASGGGAPGFAGGGYIRGPGTSTSDSIPMWGSDGEYMVKAAAVSRVGVPTLDRINAGQMPHFAEGGLVGAGGGGTAVHLHIGDRSFALTASQGTADSLVHEARTRHILSTGRKPSWHGA